MSSETLLGCRAQCSAGNLPPLQNRARWGALGAREGSSLVQDQPQVWQAGPGALTRAQLLSAAPALLGVEWGWQGLTRPGPPNPGSPSSAACSCSRALPLTLLSPAWEVLPPTAPLLAEGPGWLPPSQEDCPPVTLSGRTSCSHPLREDFLLTLSGGLPSCHPLREDFLLSPSQEDFPPVTLSGGLPALTLSGRTSCSHPLRRTSCSHPLREDFQIGRAHV